MLNQLIRRLMYEKQQLSELLFALWLAVFLFVRVPFAALQQLTGYDFQPYLCIDVLAVAFGVLGWSRKTGVGLSFLQWPTNKRLALGLLAFWLIYVLRLALDHSVFDVDFVRSAPRLLRESVASTLVVLFALPWLVPRELSIRLFNWVALIGNAFIASGLLVYVLSHDVLSGRAVYRFSFPDLNPIPAGHSSASLLIVGSVLLLFQVVGSSQRSLFWLINSVVGLLIGFTAVVASGTRSAVVALLPLLIIGSILMIRHLRRRGAIALIAFSIAGLIGAVASSPIGPRLIRSGYDSSSTDRLSILGEGFRLFGQHPLFGKGFASQQVLHSLPTLGHHWYPHNLPVEALMIGGLALAVPLGLFVCCCAMLAWRDFSRPGLSLVITLLWLQGAIYALFSGHIGSNPLFWAAGLMLACVCNPQQQRQDSMVSSAP